ncbi:hypothetical protein [Glutamicibacter sp. JC586]|uniref:hypothetical protein n=1 Tax=Glutamicibacter sp. JC586 TaxID=2590552 RepID=UPI00135C9D78|nr:hypothetical protein [Glutamicibacter sp. JC586]
MDDFLKVDFATPLILLCVAVIFFLLCIPMLIHGLIRRRNFSRLRDGEQIYSLRSSIRTELIMSALAAVLVIACLVIGFTGYGRAMNNLQANIEREFSPTELEIHFWTGSSAIANISLPDGTSYDPATISVEEGYRPVINEAP